MEHTDQPVEYTSAAGALETRELKRLNIAATFGVAVSAYLVPGLGHLILGRWGRGLIFAGAVVTMFLMGIAMQGKLYDLAFEHPLQLFALIANIGGGALYIVAQQLNWGAGTLTAQTFDYGTTFLWVAGLLNYLIILDAFDIAQGRKP